MSNVLGICSVCGIRGDLSAIQIHYNESHIICEDENFTEGDEDENANGTIAAVPSISGVNKMQWSEKSVKLLLALYKEHLELFKNSKKTNKSIWSQISGKMVEQGYTVTWEDCDIKFRNLKKTYKRIKDNNKLTGRGAKQWTYFNILDELFGTDADINPPCVINNSVMDRSNKDSTSEDLTDLENMKGTNEKPRRKRQSDDEPTWLKRYRADAAQRHEEKMQLLRDLIGTLKEK